MKKNLLVIDDESEIRSVISVVAKEEFNVIEAGCGMGALEALRTQQIDVILTDYFMPNMNGLELTKILDERRLNIPVVVMTGYGSLDLHGRFLASRIFDYVDKPFRFDSLMATLKRSLVWDKQTVHGHGPSVFTQAYYDQFNLSLSKGTSDWVKQRSQDMGVSMSTFFDDMIRQYKLESGET